MKLYEYTGIGSEAGVTALVVASSYQEAIDTLLNDSEFTSLMATFKGVTYYESELGGENVPSVWRNYVSRTVKDVVKFPSENTDYYHWRCLSEDLTSTRVVDFNDRVWD